MFSDKELEYYNRQLRLDSHGLEAQKKLKNSSVLVIGAGGLGNPVLQYLSAAGIGTIGIIDGDTVEVTNLHRQVMFTYDDIGKPKVEVARNFIEKRNPHIHIEIYKEFIDYESGGIIENYDIIIDGSDNFDTRYIVNDLCILKNKSFIYGGIFEFEAQVSVFNFKNGPSYRCLFPERPQEEYFPSCEDNGVLGIVPGITGMYQALQAIKLIIYGESNLSGRLLLLDFRENSTRKISIPRIEKHFDKEYIRFLIEKHTEDKHELREYTWSDFSKLTGDSVHLIDVRSKSEYKNYNLGGKNIPLPKLKNYDFNYPDSHQIIFICQKGKRSERAAEILAKRGYINAGHISGGIESIE